MRMDETIIILITVIISAVLSGIFALFTERRAQKAIESKEAELKQHIRELLKNQGQAVINTIEEALVERLDPILKLNSQAMGIIGSQGAKVNQIKMMEKQMMEAVNESLPISPDMIAEFSPALAETLRKYPELMPKALQVFEKITGGKGDWGLNTGGGSRPHPLSSRIREE